MSTLLKMTLFVGVLLLGNKLCGQFSNGKFLSKTIRFQNFTIDNGLSQGYVSSVVQDRNGFLWIASSDGINRFDGYSFTVYKNERDTLSPASNNVKQIFEDTAGRLWITYYYHAGLDLFDKELGQFIHVIPIKNHKVTRDHTATVNILGSYGNGIVIALNKDFYTINVEKEALRHEKKGQPFFFLKTHRRQLYPATGSASYSWGNSANVSTTAKGAIWMLDMNSSLFELKIYPEKDQYKLIECVVPSALVPPHAIKTSAPFYCVDWHRELIYFQQYGNIYRLNGKSGVIELFIKNTAIESYTVSAADADGNIWFSHKGQLYEMDVAQKKLYQVRSDNLEIEEKKEFTCSTIYVDLAGNVWICTTGYGLLKINLNTSDFHHIKMKTPVDYSVKWINNSINGNFHLVSWKGNDFLFDAVAMRLIPSGLQSVNGIPFWNRKKIALYPFKIGKSSIPIDILNTGNYFLKEWNVNGLALIQPEKGFVALLYKEEKEVLGPFLLGKEHTAWFVGGEKTLYSINLATGVVNAFKIPEEIKSVLQTMARDEDGNIWIATEQGICLFDVSAKKWRIYLQEKKRADGLLFDNILCFSFCRSYPGMVWIGTEGDGLIKMNIANGSCKYYLEDNGLSSEVVYSILPDTNGHFWMSTLRGLSCLNPASGQFRNFTYEDGLQSNEFNRYSYGISPSGRMMFGGVNGINYFDPSEIVTNRYNAKILLTNVFVNGKYIAPWAGDLSLRHSLYNLHKEIKLRHDQNVLNLQFSSSDFTTPGLNRFSYKLEGIDKEWSPSSTDHEATYTYLPPGSYIFKVRGTNRDGIWSPNELSFPFLIRAPWWQSWWFRTLVVIIVIASVYGFFKFRMNQLLKMQAIRNRISADMHDEIGSTLSSISFYSQALLMQNLDQKQRLVIAKIKDVAQRVQEELSDIVWSVKADMDSFENIFVRMQRVGNELLGAKNIFFHFVADEKLYGQKMEMMTRKNFYLIFKEALNNAAKYAQCKNVWVIISDDCPRIKMEIRDDGAGFDLGVAKNGNGLENMQQRAVSMKGKLTICSTHGRGTEVVLIF